MAIADLDFDLITKRKRMLDSVGHYSRPDLFQVHVDKTPRPAIHETAPAATVPFEEVPEPNEDTRLPNSRPLKKAVAAL